MARAVVTGHDPTWQFGVVVTGHDPTETSELFERNCSELLAGEEETAERGIS